MNEKWMEEIRRNDNTLLLKKYFPGQSCGNEECEKQGIELCKILEKNIFLQKEDISRIAAKQMIIPDSCPFLIITHHPYLCCFKPISKNQKDQI